MTGGLNPFAESLEADAAALAGISEDHAMPSDPLAALRALAAFAWFILDAASGKREAALAKTKLQEMAFWADQAVKEPRP